MAKKEETNDGGLQGLGLGVVNTNSKEFKFLQKKIINEFNKQSSKEILENRLLSLRFQMESYLRNDNNEIKRVGVFLKEYVLSLGVKNKFFAEYIGYKEPNLSALYSGKRKINSDLALKLGKIFNVDPTLWIQIQSKNDLKKMIEENETKYNNYNIEDLLKKAS